VFRGQLGDLIKVLWYDGDGLCFFAKRLERGRFVWPASDQRHSFFDACAVIDVAGRYRLAASRADVGATVVRNLQGSSTSEDRFRPRSPSWAARSSCAVSHVAHECPKCRKHVCHNDYSLDAPHFSAISRPPLTQ